MNQYGYTVINNSSQFIQISLVLIEYLIFLFQGPVEDTTVHLLVMFP